MTRTIFPFRESWPTIAVPWRRPGVLGVAPRTHRTRIVASMFGLELESGRKPDPEPDPEAKDDATQVTINVPLPPGGIVLITGGSGSGKSLLLDSIAHQLRAHEVGSAARLRARKDESEASLRADDGIPLESLRADDRHAFRSLRADPNDLPQTCALVDQVAGSLRAALETLARAGLADAKALVRPPTTLSTGERWRFALASAIARANDADDDTPAVILADEFCSTLDDLTIASVCHGVRRWIAQTTHTLIVSGARDGLDAALEPDVIVRCSHATSPTVETHDAHDSHIEETMNGPAHG